MTTERTSEILQQWTEILMKHSMKNLLLFCKENSFSMSQLGALFHIYREGSSGVAGIGGELGVTSAAASQMLDRMVQEGIISRSEDPHDRRLKLILLTTKGRDFMHQSLNARQQWLYELVNTLTPGEQEQVIKAMAVLIEKAEFLDRQANPAASLTHQ